MALTVKIYTQFSENSNCKIPYPPPPPPPIHSIYCGKGLEFVQQITVKPVFKGHCDERTFSEPCPIFPMLKNL